MSTISTQLSPLRKISSAIVLSICAVTLAALCLISLPTAYANPNPDAASALIKPAQHEASPKQSGSQQALEENGKLKETSPIFLKSGAGREIGIGQWFRTIVSLFFVVILIFIFAWLAKKIQGKTSQLSNDIQVLSSFALSSKERLIKIQVDGKRLLLAVSPSGIQLITHLDGKHDSTVGLSET